MPKEIVVLNVEDIIVGERIRKVPGEDIRDLMNSLEVNGQIHPIALEDKELIVGFRRWVSAVMLKDEGKTIKGLEPGQIEAVNYYDLTPLERIVIEFEENVRRRNFSDAEEAIAISKLKLAIEAESGGTIANKDLAKVLKYSTAHVSMALQVADAVVTRGKTELLKAKSVDGAYRQLKTGDKLDELLKRAEKAEAKSTQPLTSTKALKVGNAKEWIKDVREESVDFVSFDPPWGIGIDDYDRNHKYGDFDDSAETGIETTKELIPELFRILKPDTYMVVWFGIQYYQFLTDILEEVGFKVNPVPYIWYKDDKSGSQNDPHRVAINVWEPFFLVQKGDPRMFKKAQTNMLTYPMPSKRLHFAQKSVDMQVDILERFTFGNMLIVDPTFGSGSLFVAAQRLGRRFAGCEKNKENYQKAIDWLKRETVK